jgi:hypothetical protein
MTSQSSTRLLRPLALLGLALAGCTGSKDDPALSKQASDAIPNVPVPPENGPPLASIADMTPVLERPARDARRLGYLHAGSRVVRAAEPYSKDGCKDGWYPIRPAGFVCVGEAATLDVRHPTLLAMAIQPSLDEPLPYTYARARVETALFERDPSRERAVREIGKLKRRAGMAVVGSWNALLPNGADERLALLTNGKFVRAQDLEPLPLNDFQGVVLDQETSLPLAWIVKRGVRSWQLEGNEAKKGELFDYHTRLTLTGRYRTVEGEKYWATSDGAWVRHKDATVVLPRSQFPDFVKDGVKWIDVSIITGTVVAYEGKRPVLATLASVARPVGADPAVAGASTGDVIPASLPAAPSPATSSHAKGTFEVTAKHITLVGANPREWGESYELYDVPWVMELSSGRKLLGAYWHDRFGIERGTGSVELSPIDAQRLFAWASPALPNGFHAYSPRKGSEGPTYVVVR